MGREALKTLGSPPGILIRATNLWKVLGPKSAKRQILQGLELEIEPGSFNIIRGTNGAGKSTLLGILGLVDRDFQGELEISGIDVSPSALSEKKAENLRTQNIGFIFQDDRLSSWLTLRENSELPARILHRPKPVIRNKVDRLQADIFKGIQDVRNLVRRRREKASGGERQRAAIVRALSHDPILLLADEPTAHLDPQGKYEVARILKSQSERGVTVLVASHDDIFISDDLSTSKRRVFELKDGQLIPRSSQEAGRGPRTSPPRQFQQELPLGNPLRLLALLTRRQTATNWFFTLMITLVMLAGTTLLTTLRVIQTAAQQVITDAVSKDSRLDRLSVSPQNAASDESRAFPSESFLKSMDGYEHHVFRRPALVHVWDADGQTKRQFVLGLQDDDPELEKLQFLAGLPKIPTGLEVLISHEKVSGLIGPGLSLEDAVGEKLDFRARRGLSSSGLFDERNFELVVAGVVDGTEQNRHLYMPQALVSAVLNWQLDLNLKTNLVPRNGTLELEGHKGNRLFEWDRVDVYFDELEAVIPASRSLRAAGFEADTDLYDNRWVLATRRYAGRMLWGLFVMILLIAGYVIGQSVSSFVQLERKEIGLLKLIGVETWGIKFIFVSTVSIATLVAGVGGLVLGHWIADWFRRDLAKTFTENVSFVEVTFLPWAECALALSFLLVFNASITAWSTGAAVKRNAKCVFD